MEGVSQEAASLAGHLKLGKLVLLYDSNDILMDQHQWLTEDVKAKFEAYGWQHILVKDGNDLKLLLKLSKKLKLRQINHLLSKLRQSLVTELKDKEHQLSTVLQLVKTALITQKVFTVTMHRHLQFQMK